MIEFAGCVHFCLFLLSKSEASESFVLSPTFLVDVALFKSSFLGSLTIPTWYRNIWLVSSAQVRTSPTNSGCGSRASYQSWLGRTARLWAVPPGSGSIATSRASASGSTWMARGTNRSWGAGPTSRSWSIWMAEKGIKRSRLERCMSMLEKSWGVRYGHKTFKV